MGNIFEENSGNPFDDPNFKKQFLKDKGLLNNDEDKTEDYEILHPQDPVGKENGNVINPVDIINQASRIPSNVGNIIHDVSSSRSIDKIQRSKEIKSALNAVFTDYNEKYGLDFHIDLDNTANMLASLSDPTDFRIFELYVSEYFGRFKAILYMKVMSAMLVLIDDILDPKKMLSSDVDYADKWIILEKVSQLFLTFEQFKDQVSISGAGTELNKIGSDLKSESGDDSGDLRSKEQVKEFMNAMLKSSGINPTDKK